MPLNLPLLARVCEAPGAPGHEKKIRELLLAELDGLADEVRVDNLGSVIAIKLMDSSVICDYRMIAYMKATAEKHGIAWQPEILSAGGTDTASLQRMVGGGSIAGAISVPTRHIHQSIESCHKQDLLSCIDLLVACARDLDKHDWAF